MTEERLPLKTKFCYSITEGGMLIISYTLSTQLMFFMTDFLGIAAGAAGTMFLVSRIWDAVNDPLMGILADRTNTRFGKYRPYLLIGGVPLVLSLFLCLCPVNFGRYNLVWMYVVYILFGMAYTATFIPFTTLLGNIARTPNDRNSLSSMKGAFTSGGVMLASMTTVPLLKHFGHQGEITITSYTKVGALFACISLCLFIITFLGVKENPVKSVPPKSYTFKFITDIIFHNKRLMLIVVIYFFMYLRVFLGNTTSMYFFRYARDQVYLMPIYAGCSSATSILAAFIVPPLAKRFGKRNVCVAGVGLSVLIYIPLYLLRLKNPVFLVVLNTLAWLSASVIYALIWAYVAEISDLTAKKQGYRADSIIYAVTSFANKFSAAIGGFVSGMVLKATGYIANQPQTPKALMGIDINMFIIPGVCMLIVFLLLNLYPKDEKAKQHPVAKEA